MKLTNLFLIFSICFVFANNVNSQNAKVKINLNKATLEEVFDEIENQTDYLFMSNREIDLSQEVSVQVTDKSVKDVLVALMEETGLSFKMEGVNIVITNSLARNLVSPASNQQNNKITGVVTDVNGDPIIGAAVVEKGTANGTITDVDGKFSLNVNKDAILRVSYIGYLAFEIKVDKATNVTITLRDDTQALDEIVVVGYGTQKKVNLTGAVTAVSGEDLAKRPVTNTSTMLQGQVPGLRVVQGLGQPGNESVSFRIRGVGTFSGAGASPLVLINGVPGDMSNLDSSMIESVSVLKDAASAAIYGARAANGVVLITTKQGNIGNDKVTITYSGNIAQHTPTKMFDLVTNSVEYMNLFNKAKRNSGESGLYPDEEIEKYRQGNGNIEYPNFDWLGYIFNPAFAQQHNLSLAGSSLKTSYNMALNYIDQDGTLKGTNYKKYNVSFDLSTRATKWLKVGLYANLMKGDRSFYGLSQDDAILSAMSQAPTYMPWLPDDGTGVKRWTHKAYNFESNNKNMVQIIENEKQRKTDNNTDANIQSWLDIDICQGLSWYTKFAVRQTNSRSENWIGNAEQMYYYQSGTTSEQQGGFGYSVGENRGFYSNLYTYLKFENSTSNKYHNISVLIGYNQESNKYQTLGASRRDYPFELETINAGDGAPNWSNNGEVEEWALMSGFFRLNYNFKERYLFEMNARYDGSSRLSPESRWGLFPSISGGWRITEERFIKNLNLTSLSSAKLRASWGKLGNQQIGLYPYQAMINKVDAYPFDKSTSSTAYFQTAYVNRDLKWETTTITDIGVDFQLFSKLNVTFDWYRKETDGILRGSQVSALLGMSAPTVNNGTMEDRGVELALSWIDIINKGTFSKLNYNIGVYVDRTRNLLKNFGVKEMDGKVIREEGLPYESYYMLECIGIFATDDEVINSPKQFNDNTQAGDLKYRDANNDGIIDNNDRVLIDGKYPGFEYGVNLGSSWKGIDISFLGQGVANKKWYINPNWGEAPFMQGSAPTKDYIEHMWTEENPYNAKYPKLYFGNLGGGKNQRTNSYFLKDASYFRVKNITLGYTLSNNLTQKIAVQKLRIYFSGDNLFTLTKFKGLDPERSGDGTATQYPQNKIISFGVNVEF